MNAWGYCRSDDDARLASCSSAGTQLASCSDAGAQLVKCDAELRWLESLAPRSQELAAADFSPRDMDELKQLALTRRQWLQTNKSYAWEAGLSLVFMGRKRR